MRVLGIDPGTRVLGYGVVDQSGSTLTAIAHGVLAPGGKGELTERLLALHIGLTSLLAEHRPEVVAVEGLFTFQNARSALVLGHARGVVLLAAAQAGLPVVEYAPAEVKKAVGAGGAADKSQVMAMVKRLLGVTEFEKADAADALALAICHHHRHRFDALVARARAGERT